MMTQETYEEIFNILLVINTIAWFLIANETMLTVWTVKLSKGLKVTAIVFACFSVVFAVTRFSYLVTGEFALRAVISSLSTVLSCSMLVMLWFLRRELQRLQRMVKEKQEFISCATERLGTISDILKQSVVK